MKKQPTANYREVNFLVVAPVYIDGNTGSSAHLRGVLTGLSMNNKLYVIANSINKEYNEFNFARVSYNGGIYNVATYFKMIYLCLYRLIVTKIDVIYERESIFIVGTLLGKLFKKKVIFEMNGLQKEIATLKKLNKIVISFIFAISFINAKLATHIIVGSLKMKHALIDEYNISENKIYVIENGVNTNVFKPISNAKQVLCINNDYFYIGFVGTLAEWQGIESIINSAVYIISKIPKALFLIVGGNPSSVDKYKNLTMEKGIADYFIFFGEVPFIDIPLYINAFDICVTMKIELESGYSPTKLYEYMACGKPIVASNTHGHSILKKYNAGILVNPNDPVEISEAIIKLYNNKSYREELGNNGITIIDRNYKWERVANQILKICEK